MSRIHPECPDSDPYDRWVAADVLVRPEPEAADVLVRQEPDEEEEEDEGDGTEDNDEGDDKNDDGYSERARQDDGYIF